MSVNRLSSTSKYRTTKWEFKSKRSYKANTLKRKLRKKTIKKTTSKNFLLAKLQSYESYFKAQSGKNEKFTVEARKLLRKNILLKKTKLKFRQNLKYYISKCKDENAQCSLNDYVIGGYFNLDWSNYHSDNFQSKKVLIKNAQVTAFLILFSLTIESKYYEILLDIFSNDPIRSKSLQSNVKRYKRQCEIRGIECKIQTYLRNY